MTDRCESRFGGHRCDKERGHAGAHYALHMAVVGATSNTVNYGIGWGNLIVPEVTSD